MSRSPSSRRKPHPHDGSRTRDRLALCLSVALALVGCDALDDAPEQREPDPPSTATGAAGQPASDPLPGTGGAHAPPPDATGPPGFRTVQPPGNFREPCEADADCDDPYQCLQTRAFGVQPSTLCSLPCTIATDCPEVFHEHCGDLTLCENGICGALGCQ